MTSRRRVRAVAILTAAVVAVGVSAVFATALASPEPSGIGSGHIRGGSPSSNSGTNPATPQDDYDYTNLQGAFVGYAEAENIYRPAISGQLPALPGDVEFPAFADLELDPTATYEATYIAGQAHFYWQCAWIVEASESLATGDSTRFEFAVAQLRSWASSSFYRTAVDETGSVGWVNDVLEPAMRGQTEKLLTQAEWCEA